MTLLVVWVQFLQHKMLSQEVDTSHAALILLFLFSLVRPLVLWTGNEWVSVCVTQCVFEVVTHEGRRGKSASNGNHEEMEEWVLSTKRTSLFSKESCEEKERKRSKIVWVFSQLSLECVFVQPVLLPSPCHQIYDYRYAPSVCVSVMHYFYFLSIAIMSSDSSILIPFLLFPHAFPTAFHFASTIPSCDSLLFSCKSWNGYPILDCEELDVQRRRVMATGCRLNR